jgi:pimeloyl-ACP methyl ester carboxylesterase
VATETSVPAPRDTWFLLRGLSREAGHWGSFLPDLRAALPEAAIHPIDLPGAGTRRHVSFPDSVAAAMEQVRTEAERVAPIAQRRRSFVFALSLGGMIAIEWAARHPYELAGMVIGSTSAGGVSPYYRRLRPNAWWRIVAAAGRKDGPSRERGILGMVSTRRDLHDETSVAWAQVARERPMKRENVAAQLRAAIRYRLPAWPPEVPTELIVGAGDRMVHPDCSRHLARRWNLPISEHPSAGHELTLDASDWVVAQIVRFARSMGDTRGA